MLTTARFGAGPGRGVMPPKPCAGCRQAGPFTACPPPPSCSRPQRQIQGEPSHHTHQSAAARRQLADSMATNRRRRRFVADVTQVGISLPSHAGPPPPAAGVPPAATPDCGQTLGSRAAETPSGTDDRLPMRLACNTSSRSRPCLGRGRSAGSALRCRGRTSCRRPRRQAAAERHPAFAGLPNSRPRRACRYCLCVLPTKASSW